MFRLLFHGRRLLIKFNKPLLLEELNVREKVTLRSVKSTTRDVSARINLN